MLEIILERFYEEHDNQILFLRLFIIMGHYELPDKRIIWSLIYYHKLYRPNLNYIERSFWGT